MVWSWQFRVKESATFLLCSYSISPWHSLWFCRWTLELHAQDKTSTNLLQSSTLLFLHSTPSGTEAASWKEWVLLLLLWIPCVHDDEPFRVTDSFSLLSFKNHLRSVCKLKVTTFLKESAKNKMQIYLSTICNLERKKRAAPTGWNECRTKHRQSFVCHMAPRNQSMQQMRERATDIKQGILGLVTEAS